MSLTDVKITQDERFNFMNPKGGIIKNAVVAALALLLVIIPYEFTITTIILKIVFGIIAVLSLIALALAPQNGLYVAKDGKIKLVDGAFGGGTFELESLKRVAVNFSEWENGGKGEELFASLDRKVKFCLHR